MSIFQIFKNKRYNNIISSIDDSISKLTIPNSLSDSNDLVSQTIRQSIDGNLDTKDQLSSILENFSDSAERSQKYKTYDELYSSLQIIKRIVKVYANNLLQTDPVSGNFIIVSHNSKTSDANKFTEHLNFCKELINYFNIEDRIRNRTAFYTLKYGDSFVEVIDLDKAKVEFPKNRKPRSGNQTQNQTVITESLNLIKSKNKYAPVNNLKFDELIDHFVDFEDYVTLPESYFSEKEELSVPKYNLSKIMLRFHSPHKIIPIATEYDSVLGYIELQEESSGGGSNTGTSNLLRFANLMNQISDGSEGSSEDSILVNFSNAIVLRILSKYGIYHTTTDEKYGNNIQSKLHSDIYNSLKRILISSKKNALFNSRLKVRYIENNDMYHFKNPDGENYPFGTSVIDSLIFPGKLLILAQLANAISKLSRASTLRKWTIETGSREDVSGLIQKLKRDFRNKRVTAEDIATSRNLPNILSDFKDIIAFKKRGQTMLDIDTVQMGQPSISTNDIEDLRRELIALSGIPSSYLGYQDMADLRDHLAHANIVFATEIVNIQNNFNDQLTRLIHRIGELSEYKIDNNFKQNVKISLRPPTFLTLQLIENTLNSLSSIQRVFNEIPEVDSSPMYLIKRLCPYVDWDEFEREANNFKMARKTKKDMGGDEAGGGFGGF